MRYFTVQLSRQLRELLDFRETCFPLIFCEVIDRVLEEVFVVVKTGVGRDRAIVVLED